MDKSDDAALWWLQSYGAEPAEQEYRHVWLWAEAEDGRLTPTTRQLTGKARELAEALGVQTEALLVSAGAHPGEALADELFSLGADVVYLVQSLAGGGCFTLRCASWLSAFVWEKRPEILLLPDNGSARDLAARVAQKLKTGLVGDCVDLAIDSAERQLVATCYGFAGRSLASVIWPKARPQIATVRPGAFPARQPEPERRGQIKSVQLPAESEAEPIRTIVTSDAHSQEPALLSARVIVIGGEEMGGPEGFARLEELAHRLGGAVGASRLAVDRGWVPACRLVDYLGHHIHPDVCIAFGVREGEEHLAAVRQSRLIVAVTRDPSAPILALADYRVLADPLAVIEALNAELQASESAAGLRHG